MTEPAVRGRWLRLVATLAVVFMLLTAAPALAGGRGKGARTYDGGCTVDGNVVHGYGLPTDQVINFLITNSSGTYGWVLGFSEGTWDVNVPDRNGQTTYEFAGRTWGKDGKLYNVFASCSSY